MACRASEQMYHSLVPIGLGISSETGYKLYNDAPTLTIDVDKVGHFALAGRKRKPAGPRLVGENEATSINLYESI
jgi:hypothetical protein